MTKHAYIGYTTMRNKLHLDTKGMDQNGTPNCGQGRVVSIEFDAMDVLSMRAAADKATQEAQASGLELCVRCFKGRVAA